LGIEIGRLTCCKPIQIEIVNLSIYHYKNGILIEEYDSDISVSKTNDLLKKHECVIYEAAFLHDSLFVVVMIVLM